MLLALPSILNLSSAKVSYFIDIPKRYKSQSFFLAKKFKLFMFYNFNKISFIEITIKNIKKERRKEIMAKLFKN